MKKLALAMMMVHWMLSIMIQNVCAALSLWKK